MTSYSRPRRTTKREVQNPQERGAQFRHVVRQHSQLRGRRLHHEPSCPSCAGIGSDRDERGHPDRRGESAGARRTAGRRVHRGSSTLVSNSVGLAAHRSERRSRGAHAPCLRHGAARRPGPSTASPCAKCHSTAGSPCSTIAGEPTWGTFVGRGHFRPTAPG